MNIFISWSGETSKKIAQEIKNWLPTVIQSAKPYYTPADIDKGNLWDKEINEKLSECLVGLICLTKDNTEKPWILFEAGALSNRLEKSKVCPVLFGIKKSQVTGPLSRFQLTDFTKPEMFDLVKSINKSMDELSIDINILTRVFDKFFPELEEKVLKILQEKVVVNFKPERSDREILEEVLELVRSNSLGVKKSKFGIGSFLHGEEFDFSELFSIKDNVLSSEHGKGIIESITTISGRQKYVTVRYESGIEVQYTTKEAMEKLLIVKESGRK